jgi:hypothetical protein
METLCSSETLVSPLKSTWCHNSEIILQVQTFFVACFQLSANVIQSIFSQNNDPVIQNFSAILYFVHLHNTVDAGHFLQNVWQHFSMAHTLQMYCK